MLDSYVTVASSLRNVTSVVSDPQVMMDVFSAVITCQINPTSSAEYCQVIARSSTDNIMSMSSNFRLWILALCNIPLLSDNRDQFRYHQELP